MKCQVNQIYEQATKKNEVLVVVGCRWLSLVVVGCRWLSSIIHGSIRNDEIK